MHLVSTRVLVHRKSLNRWYMRHHLLHPRLQSMVGQRVKEDLLLIIEHVLAGNARYFACYAETLSYLTIIRPVEDGFLPCLVLDYDNSVPLGLPVPDADELAQRTVRLIFCFPNFPSDMSL